MVDTPLVAAPPAAPVAPPPVALPPAAAPGGDFTAADYLAASLKAKKDGNQTLADAFGKKAGELFDQERKRLSTSPRKVEPTIAGDTWGELGSDLGRTALSKPLEGLVKTPGILGDVGALTKLGRDYAVSKFSGTPLEEQRKQPILGFTNEDLARHGSEAYKKSFEDLTGSKFYEPKTRVGQVLGGGLEMAGGAAVPIPGVSGVRAAVRGAETLGQTVKAGGRQLAKDAALYGAAPGSLSELGGILTEGSKAEPWVRGGIALGAGGAAALASGRTKLEADFLKNLTSEQLDQTEALFRQSIAQKTPLTRAEAAQLITKGGTNLADIQRWVEGSGNARMQRFMAARGDQLRSAQDEIFGRTVGPAATETSRIGGQVRDAAESVIADTPQARSVTQAEAAIPPLSPERSGNVIQPELTATRGGLADARAAEAKVKYGEAYNQPAPGGAAPGAASATPRMVPAAAVESLAKGIAEAQVLAKGAPLSALDNAAKIIRRKDGTLENSVEGLHQSRIALDDAISEAQQAGQAGAVKRLMDAKIELDAQLKAIPEFKTADVAFQKASAPLEPFERGPLGAPSEITPITGKPEMPASQVPGALQKAGPEGAQALVDTMTPAASSTKEMGDFLAAKILRDSGGSPAGIRKAMTDPANVDTLKRFPDAATRLEGVATARAALETERGRGPLAGLLRNEHPETVQAVNALLGNPNISAEEMKTVMGQLAAKNPRAAAELLRFHLDQEFAKARDVSRTVSHADQVSGAVFAKAVGGNEQSKARLLAGVEAVHGPDAAKGLQDFLTVLTAMGERQGVGSRTSFNLQYAKDLEAGNMATAGMKAFLDAPTKLGVMKGVVERWNNWTRAGNEDKIARLLTDPEAAAQFRALSEGGGTTARATRAVAKIGYLMDRITREPEGGQPLHITVRARPEKAQ